MTSGSDDPPVIQLSAVGYTYAGPPPVQALKPTDLVITRGEHVAIMGPSGSGKSTLLNLLGLLDRPTEGRLEIDGIDLGRASERDRAAVRARHIGFVFQSFHLSLLLCDEPTGNLDTAATKELTDLLGALRDQGTTLLVITHNPLVAAQAQRQIRIRDGMLSEHGPALPENPELPDDPWVQTDPWAADDPAAHQGERNGGSHALPGG
jgi:ABC-type lipoprotein export system ATPase subunit